MLLKLVSVDHNVIILERSPAIVLVVPPELIRKFQGHLQ